MISGRVREDGPGPDRQVGSGPGGFTNELREAIVVADTPIYRAFIKFMKIRAQGPTTG